MRGALRTAGRWGVRVLAGVGAVLLVLTVVGAAVDAAGFDRTRGGYEPPYEGWTGEPIDWAAGAVTPTGFLDPGRVVDTTLDCTTGMIGFGVWGVSVDFRVVSERAIVVHRPREACEAAGFDPRF
ncbi:hypothetical protein [Aquipuribacter nitratireducens]|uniref:Uncharacterized protein n=1 Tax=Aquipuribacter nitratireducens TaxID=650104 RepID=A0ABW0GND2_9MICO